MTKRRALVCGPTVPEYDRESGSRRIYDAICFLQQAGWAVTFTGQGTDSGRRYARLLRRQGVAVHEVTGADVHRLIEFGKFDLILFAFWVIAEQYLSVARRLSPASRIVIDSIDLHFVRCARETFSRERDSGPPVLDGTYGDLITRELNVYAAADAVLTVSAKEAVLLNDVFGLGDLATVVPDNEDLERSAVPFDDRNGVLFLGNFRHRPNLDAVEHLCTKILPRIDKRVVERHPIRIVGNAAEKALRYTAAHPGVQVTGWVPSVLPYLETARVSVIPLLYGAGTKRKLLQSLMVGTPTVSTSIGVEGFDLQVGRDVLVADEPAAFAAGVEDLLVDSVRWNRMASEGRARVERSHGRETARACFLNMVYSTLSRPPGQLGPPATAPSAAAAEVRMERSAYERMKERTRDRVRKTLPRDASVAVITKGDDDLLRLDVARAAHLPATADGRYAGYHPAQGKAVAELEAAAARGAQFLIVPKNSLWWLDYYSDVASYLHDHGRLLVAEDETCRIYSLPGIARNERESSVCAPSKPCMTCSSTETGV